MKHVLAIAGGVWLFAGAMVARNALMMTGVLHQQYVTMEVILGAMLASFGMLMIGLAGIIDALQPSPAPTRMIRGELVS
jgi:hypothetical protein